MKSEKIKINEIEVIIYKKSIKHLYLRVKNGKVEVSCNRFVSDEIIKNFVLKHYNKIINKIKPKKEESFYIKNAPKIILPLVKKYSKLMNLYPSKVSFRFKSTSWGSCSAKNHIIFNYHLIDYPIKAVEYVVVHELAHIKHKNHQKEFWDLVKKFYPEYKIAKEILRSL